MKNNKKKRRNTHTNPLRKAIDNENGALDLNKFPFGDEIDLNTSDLFMLNGKSTANEIYKNMYVSVSIFIFFFLFFSPTFS